MNSHFSNMTSVKSGEIFRISSGHFNFLCLHCGFNFLDVREIFDHIDSHFDDSIEDTKDTKDSEIIPELTQIHQLAEMNTELGLSELPEIKMEDDKDDATSSLFIDHTNRNKGDRGKSNRRRKPAKLLSHESEEISVVTTPHQCPVCDLSCDNIISYRNHLRAIHQIYGNVYQCYICGLYCRNLSVLKKHISCTVHSTKNPKCYQCELEPPITNEIDSRQHKCFFCKQFFPNHLQFRIHFKNDHHQDVDKFFSKKENCNEFTCYICKKDFALKYYLKTHMVVHNDNKAFVCDICGKRYRTYAILRRHLNVHEGKTYNCDDCGKTFGYYARLRIHRYSHRTELNYKCKVCSKAFKVQKYLARHMVTHRDEKKFACRYCAKRFTFSTGRRAHEVSQHNAV